MTDPTGVLDLVRAKAATIINEGPPWDASDIAFLEAIPPLVEALVAQDDFYAHSADCVDEGCREEERLEGVAISKRHVALTDLLEQLQEKAGA